MRKEYECNLWVNFNPIRKIIIDQHYKLNHPEMNDELIIKLVEAINGFHFIPIQESAEFRYYKVEPIFYEEKPYRLIFLIPKHDNFLGVINAFRVRSKK